MVENKIDEISLWLMHICMNWDASSFDWTQARAFLVTADTGSFSAAARALNLTQPTLGRQVAGLEAALGVVLFERIGKRLVLTPAGQDILEHIRDMGEAANRASLIASGRTESVSGDVLVSVTDIMAQYVMPQVIIRLRKIAPQIRLRVIAQNSLSDLQRREADIAIRHVIPTQPELICRKVRESHGFLFASRGFLGRHGAIDTVADTSDAPFVTIGPSEDLLPFLLNWGLPVTDANIQICVDSGPAGWEMARQGLGIIPMTDDIACHFPEMVKVLPDLEPISVPYWLTTHRELHSSRKIRLIFDQLAEILSQPDLPISVGADRF